MELIKDSKQLYIPFQDIEIATKNFTTLIGKGGFGNVYKGELSHLGQLTTVAVKRLDGNISGQGLKEFLTEIHLLSRYKNPNLVSLLGFCDEGKEKILVYEYAEHGSLDKFLAMDSTTCPLTCKKMINVCIDAACGLDYLHNHAAKNMRIIHRDIKSANILLDHDWKGMISDLGLSKLGRANEEYTFVITNACGTHGYCDPKYRHTGVLTKESDVYSFGVVLFEVLCRRPCIINVNDERRFLDSLAQHYYEKGRLHEIIDPVMKEQLHPGTLNKISEIACQCLRIDRETRPSIALVVKKLQEALELQDIGGLAMDYKEINRMSHRPPLEYNSNEELTTPKPRLSPIYIASRIKKYVATSEKDKEQEQEQESSERLGGIPGGFHGGMSGAFSSGLLGGFPAGGTPGSFPSGGIPVNFPGGGGMPGSFPGGDGGMPGGMDFMKVLNVRAKPEMQLSLQAPLSTPEIRSINLPLKPKATNIITKNAIRYIQRKK